MQDTVNAQQYGARACSGGCRGVEGENAGAEESSGAKTGLIIGIVIGVIVLLGPHTA